jgi:hypothetical protein
MQGGTVAAEMTPTASVALDLGRALLWVAFEDFGVYLLQALCNQIKKCMHIYLGNSWSQGRIW